MAATAKAASERRNPAKFFLGEWVVITNLAPVNRRREQIEKRR
jgi:hypothetical protein